MPHVAVEAAAVLYINDSLFLATNNSSQGNGSSVPLGKSFRKHLQSMVTCFREISIHSINSAVAQHEVAHSSFLHGLCLCVAMFLSFI